MKKIFLILICIISLTQAKESGFDFYSGSLLFKPLVVNTFEPRVGLIWHVNGNRLRLDIGNSTDLFQYKFESPKKLLTIGSDFFTYTLLRGESNFHFPVDASDYFFGFNVNYRESLGNGILSTRLRLSHISAHFVDGHFDGYTHVWKDGLSPRIYSREFFDLAVAFEPTNNFRGYIGGIFIWHIDPTNLPKLLSYLGGEYHYELNNVFSPYVSYQFTATGVRPRHEVQSGLKIGNWYGRGTQLYFMYHYGNSIHGEYYDVKDEYSGFGFLINF